MKTFFTLVIIAVCGASTVVHEKENLNRITNGNVATDFQYPYMVSIQEISQLQLATRGHRCGGVLITFQHVLTAASCFFRTVNTGLVQVSPSEFRIFAGSANLANDFNQNHVRFIANVSLHPEFIGYPALVNDIAVITLQAPFLNTTVTPIGLPSVDFVPADFALCTVAGWGASDFTANASTQLRYTTKYIYNQNLCTSVYNTAPYIANIFPSMICAASYDIISAGCTGDQGNPLVCHGGLTGILFLTNNCQASSFPEVYTRVSNYTTWIRSVTGAAYTFRPDFVFYAIFVLVQIVTIKVIS